ncbi:hypothetical protein WJX82_009547 [Trebouxia sp. C0006]
MQVITQAGYLKVPVYTGRNDTRKHNAAALAFLAGFTGLSVSTSSGTEDRVCAYFGIVFVLSHLMAPQPYRDYTGAHNTRLLTSSTFTELVVEGAANKRC